MRNLNRISLIILLILSSKSSFSQERLDSMLSLLKQRNYGKLYNIPDSISNYQIQAIPKLIALLRDTSYVKLTNTADLIYPGADKYYGEGHIVNYDIDWINVRAAWVLEEITFQDFGYLNHIISKDSLMAIHKSGYSTYLQKGYHDVDFKEKTNPKQLLVYRLILAARVEKWWEENKKTWTRFNALKDALTSHNMIRERIALLYLRYGETKCDGLDKKTYETILKPLVIKIRNSKSTENEQAKYLLEDKEYYWYQVKHKG